MRLFIPACFFALATGQPPSCSDLEVFTELDDSADEASLLQGVRTAGGQQKPPLSAVQQNVIGSDVEAFDDECVNEKLQNLLGELPVHLQGLGGSGIDVVEQEEAKHVCAETLPRQMILWPQYLNANKKCVGVGPGCRSVDCRKSNVDSHSECQSLAAGRGHNFYSIKLKNNGRLRCITAGNCDVPVPDDGFSMYVTRCTFWPEYLGAGQKCNNNINVQYVANHRACQDVAESAGHPYYSFLRDANSAGQHKCMSSERCDAPRRSNRWHTYVAPNPSLNERVARFIYQCEVDQDLNLLSVNRSARVIAIYSYDFVFGAIAGTLPTFNQEVVTWSENPISRQYYGTIESSSELSSTPCNQVDF